MTWRCQMRVCMEDGCPEQTERTYCTEHARHRRRSPSSRVTGTHAFRKVAREVLERDNYTCRYCGRHAGTVDHVVPVSQGGAKLDPANLVAACSYCNSSKGAK